MDIQPIIDELAGRGVILTLEDDRLLYHAPRGALTPDIKETIRLCKPWIMRQLHAGLGRVGLHLATSRNINVRCQITAWNADDWREYFDERAGIAEYDGGMKRKKAERVAFDSCVIHWLKLNPDRHADPNTCPHCRKPSGIMEDTPSIFYANPHGLTLQVHDDCFQSWLANRQKQAVETLTGMRPLADNNRYTDGI